MSVDFASCDKIFIDTNVWIYLYSKDQLIKQKQAKELIEQASLIVVSTQVLNELINVFMKKYNIRINVIEKILYEILGVAEVTLVDVYTIKNALHISAATKYSYFDSLMLASALACNCSFFFSEDMKSGHILDDKLQIINPFKI